METVSCPPTLTDLPFDLMERIITAVEATDGPGHHIDQQLSRLREVSRACRDAVDVVAWTRRRDVLSTHSRATRRAAGRMSLAAARDALRLGQTACPPSVEQVQPGPVPPVDENLWRATYREPSGHSSATPPKTPIDFFFSARGLLAPGYKLSLMAGPDTFVPHVFRASFEPPLAGRYWLGADVILETMCHETGLPDAPRGSVARLLRPQDGRAIASSTAQSDERIKIAPVAGFDENLVILRAAGSAEFVIWGRERAWQPLPWLSLPYDSTDFRCTFDRSRQVLLGNFHNLGEISMAQNEPYQLTLLSAELCESEVSTPRGWKQIPIEAPSQSAMYFEVTSGNEHGYSFVAEAGKVACLMMELETSAPRRQLACVWDATSGRLLFQREVWIGFEAAPKLMLYEGLFALQYKEGLWEPTRLCLVDLGNTETPRTLWDVPVDGPQGVLPVGIETPCTCAMSFGRLWVGDRAGRIASLRAGTPAT